MSHNVDGSANRFSRLFRRHSSEIAHFDELGQRLVFLREQLQGGVQIQQFHLRCVLLYFEMNTGRKRLKITIFIASTLFRARARA